MEKYCFLFILLLSLVIISCTSVKKSEQSIVDHPKIVKEVEIDPDMPIEFFLIDLSDAFPEKKINNCTSSTLDVLSEEE